MGSAPLEVGRHSGPRSENAFYRQVCGSKCLFAHTCLLWDYCRMGGNSHRRNNEGSDMHAIPQQSLVERTNSIIPCFPRSTQGVGVDNLFYECAHNFFICTLHICITRLMKYERIRRYAHIPFSATLEGTGNVYRLDFLGKRFKPLCSDYPQDSLSHQCAHATDGRRAKGRGRNIRASPLFLPNKGRVRTRCVKCLYPP